MTALPSFPFVRSESDETDPVAIALRDQAPLARARTVVGDEVWVALTYRAARQAITDDRFSRAAAFEEGAPRTTTAQSTPGMIISLYGEEHARARQLLAKALTPRSQERTRPQVRRLVDDLLGGLGSPAELISQFATPLPVTAICQLFGAPEADWERFRVWADHIQETTSFTAEEIMDSVSQLKDYGHELVDLKRREPGEDLTSDLLRIADETGELTEDQIVDNLLLILVAANDATLKEIAVCLVTLLRRPDVYSWLTSHPEHVSTAVEELIRYSRLSRSGLPIRVAMEDVELEGCPVRKGEGVIPLNHVAHRDPAVFTDPDQIDLTRQEAAKHLGFGGGAHYCIGAPFARVIMQEAFSGLVRHLPTLRLAVPWSELEWQEDGLLRSPKAIPVTW